MTRWWLPCLGAIMLGWPATALGDSPVSAVPTSLMFEQAVADGPTPLQSSTVTNNSGGPVIVSVAVSGPDNADFAVLTGGPNDCSDVLLTLADGSSCDVRVTFDPTTTGSKPAQVDVTTSGGNTTVSLTGTATALSRSPTALAFGDKDIDLGGTPVQESTITNPGPGTVTLSASPIEFGGDGSQFEHMTGDGDDCGANQALAAGGTCKVRVRFNPNTTGSLSATVIVHSDTPDVTVRLTGRGTETSASVSPTSHSFGSKDIDDGASVTKTSTISNTGTEPLHLTGVTLGGTDPSQFEIVPFEAGDCTSSTTLTQGQSCTVRSEFNPSTSGSKSAAVSVTSTELLPLTINLAGTGIQTELSIAPASLSFGSKDIDDGATAAQPATITNSGSEPVTLTAVTVPSDFEQVSGTGTNCATGTALAANATCKVYVAFNPSSTGAKTDSVTVTSNAAPVSVAVDGTGVQTGLQVAPSTLPFANRDIDDGASAALDSTVTNTGTEPVTISGVSIGGGNPADFAQLTDQPSTDCAAGTTLDATETCKLRVRFDPSDVGARAAVISIASNAVPLSVALEGTGIQTAVSASPAALSFGSKDIDDGATASQSSTVTNNGTETVTLTSVGATGDFAQVGGAGTDCAVGTSLPAGNTCSLRVAFDPSAVGARTGTATVLATGGVSASVALDGTGGQTALSSNVASISAGSQDVDDGPTTTQEATLTNTATLPVSLSNVSLGGSDAGEFERLTGGGSDCGAGVSLTEGQTCTIRVRFDPGSTGAKSASVTVSSNAAEVTIDLSGTGIQTSLSREPDTLDFGSRPLGSGTTPIQESIVSNTGTEATTLGKIRLLDPGAARFLLVSGLPADCAAGMTLAAGETCKLRAMFVAQAVGAKTGTVVFTSPLGEATVVLTARGTPAPRLAIPAFSARAGDTRKKRLPVPVTPVAGTIRGVVVEVRTRDGKLLGTGSLLKASSKRTVTVRLQSRLARGTYVAKARGRNMLGSRVTASRVFRLR